MGHEPATHETIRTSCGRTLTIGDLDLDGLGHPVRRVTVDLAHGDYDHGDAWMSLTPDEARQLAARLLAHAGRADKVAQASETPGQDRLLTVLPLADTAYQVSVRGHELLADQPADAGGADLGPQPIELFAAGLASCVAHYAGGYLTRHGYGRQGLRVMCEYDLVTRPARIGAVRLRIDVPPGLPAEQHEALLAVARHCTAHNTLHQPPTVDIGIE